MNLSDVTNTDVLNELFKFMSDGQRAVLCSVAGDPSTAAVHTWAGIPWELGSGCHLHADRNNYVAISSFCGNSSGGYRRRKDQFGAVHCIMVDDVGTKIDHNLIRDAPIVPSMSVETSPGNYQVTYFLDQPLLEQEDAENCIRGMIAKLTGDGIDPGMAGVTRVLRLPVGINGKPKYMREGCIWNTRLAYWRPDIRTRWSDLCEAFEVKHTLKAPFVEPADAVTLERKRCFSLTLEALGALGRIKRRQRGWCEIRCPWVMEHTDKKDTGAAVAFPAAINGWFGGFKCHHGHCEQRVMSDLEEWAARSVYERGKATRGDFKPGDIRNGAR